MRNLLIDVSRLLGRLLAGRLPTGVDRVSLEYVRRFGGRVQALVRYGGRWLCLSPADSRRIFDALLAPSENFRSLVRLAVAKAYIGLGSASRPGSILLNVDHNGLERPDYLDKVHRLGLRPVFFLHDLIPITFPEYSRPGEAEKHLRRLETMVGCGQGFVVNSADTRAALESEAHCRGWQLPPCTVAPLAPALLSPPLPKRPLPEPYFVVLGTIEPRKNHLLLLNLWRQMIGEIGRHAPRLVIIGQRGWECEQVLDMLDRCESLRGLVLEQARCNDVELVTWLHHAQALLFPSFVEGYGIPLVEALSAGLPVIASDLPVFRETAGEIPDYLSPLDGLGWKHAILDYLPDNSVRRRAQLARMTGYAAPTWENHFAVVDELLQQL